MNINFPDVKINDRLIVGSIAILLVSLLLLTIYVFQIILKNSETGHQKKQLEMARAAALGINFSFNHITEDLTEALINFGMEDGIDHHKGLDSSIVKSVELSPGNKKSAGAVLSNYGLIKNTAGQKKLGLFFTLKDSLMMYVSDIYAEEKISGQQELRFAVLIIKNRNGSNSESIVESYLFAELNFEWFLDSFIKPLHLTENDFAWIIDSGGRLIYHPQHREMMFRNIHDANEECLACHPSFEVQKKMILQKEGTGDYFISGEPGKVMAYTSISFGNREWILAISTYTTFIQRSVISNLVIILVLTGVIVLIILLIGWSAYQLNIKRIRAEEAEKQLLQNQIFQEKLSHAAKLASIGELVDSVAHEINTPTSVIKTIADTMKLESSLADNCGDNLDLIARQTDRIRNYTKSLLKYSRRMPFAPENNDLVDLIEECIFLVGPRLKSQRVNLIKNLPDNFPEFVFDRARIEQVIINLLNNAIDFIPEKGSVEITLSISEGEGGKDGEMAVIEVEDNGIGIKLENRESVFEPFFSTKPISTGTGLGLSISKAIIERHDGRISVTSETGTGTCFRFCLPLNRRNDGS